MKKKSKEEKYLFKKKLERKTKNRKNLTDDLF